MIFSITSSFFKKYLKIFIYFFLIVITCIVYQNIHQYDFINFDDDAYVTDNSQIQKGLSFQNIAWAFGFSETANHFYWHPVTWVSHMADCQLFGLNAGMHHLMNVIFHVMNALLLFVIFYKMTGALWQSAFVAVVFAVHPINVESVAWVSERKNLLSTLFWMLSMLAYAYYVKKPSARRYFLLTIPFILGLLAKPMLVTLPCVFLLMDFWPLGRLRLFPLPSSRHIQTDPPSWQSAPVHQLIAEKLPLLIISFFSVGISLFSAHMSRQIISAENIPLSLRLENAVVSYVKYIGNLFCPKDLAVFYPFPDTIPVWQVVSAAVILLLITAAAVRLIQKAPYLIVGWLWYLGTLFPVSGISQHGRWPEMADRWAYIPEIGLLIIIAWGGASLLARLPGRRFILPTIAATVITLLALTAKYQAAYWENSIALFEHALDVTKNNSVAHFNLGIALTKTGKTDEAIRHYQRALRIDPNHPDIHINLGNALAQKGYIDKAILHLSAAVKIDDQNATARYNLGTALATVGRIDEAIQHFLAALKMDPNNDKAHINLGSLLAQKGNLTEAVEHLKAAITLNPENCLAYFNLSVISQNINTINDAMACYTLSVDTQDIPSDIRRKLEMLRLLKKKLKDER
ncbi:MAG: tetratricopeptide repeat protein [Desulfobacteraceae bacterium]|nr:tetratricopeptide repeat protein [Desulfobacteraceae bacterium]MBC2756400.1 tetratricopeptide repeat protein [Desulfobacteraceae bacterium]MBC2763530.1 tetratricopeptide repeat protein [ANME-2 cluster archaeon]